MLKLLQTSRCWLLALLCPALVQAFPMHKVTVPLGHPANGSILHLPEQRQLWVSGFSQYERWLTQVDLSSYQTRSIAVPEQAQYFSQAKLAGQDAEQLVLLTLDGILQLEQVHFWCHRHPIQAYLGGSCACLLNRASSNKRGSKIG